MPRLFLLLLGPLATGCVIYDRTGCGKHHGDDCEVEGDTAGLSGGGGGDDTADDEAPAPIFTLDPAELEAGSTTIVSLTAENFDLSTVEGVEAYGPVDVVATSNRGTELLLTVVASAEAADGQTADLLLEVGDEGEYIEDAFTVRVPEDGSGGTDTGEDCE